jgi:hypothetical protein
MIIYLHDDIYVVNGNSNNDSGTSRDKAKTREKLDPIRSVSEDLDKDKDEEDL